MTDTNNTGYTGPSRVFSGVQPSGALHLGNYLGALKKFVDLQDEMECVYCIVDLHAITVWQDPQQLSEQTRLIAAAFLASGVDPQKAIVYNQSAVKAHTELAWYFNCVARMGWVQRMTQFKDKAGKNSERMSVGLFDYPVLQAADILAFKATHVPVGEDQKQHLELSQQIAAKFNHDFNVPHFFPEPEALIKGPGARVMSLRDGTSKMSKSDPSDNSRINLTDSADVISKKIKKAKTDGGFMPESVEEMEGRPEIKNLIGIYAALSGKTDADIVKSYAGKGFGVFKPDLADLAVERLSPITDLMNRYLADPDELDRILAAAADKASEIADPIVADVRRTIGFIGA
ncbi:tryptophanyl-tRNA synthetase [Litorimonas taeanensis]|uniref:Tryptophan--tRNA ligase n=1 Tax=Litorimonas taeanensis TaxID=568099 RepID=A0A420WEW1_9PROT|nr:tryptophan--tRNA ligase [Litorimonas taeanensis]RKQ69509.1 tryptophanyl-tRNA synthetase [Litorimonas taeanensis]